MGNSWFRFKQFTIQQKESAMKVGTDSVVLGAWISIQKANTILDVGTGTGILALMLAQRSSALIDAVESNKSACLEAVKNVKSSPWHDRIRVIESSFQDFWNVKKMAGLEYDLIISNPPYYSNSLPAKTFERTLARHSNTLTVSELLKGVNVLLKPHGRLGLVMPYPDGKQFIAVAKERGFYCNRLLKLRSRQGRPVKRLLMELSRQEMELETQYLVISESGQNQYTKDYIEMTKDFYLDF